MPSSLPPSAAQTAHLEVAVRTDLQDDWRPRASPPGASQAPGPLPERIPHPVRSTPAVARNAGPPVEVFVASALSCKIPSNAYVHKTSLVRAKRFSPNLLQLKYIRKSPS